jgi:hypothetical protein
MSSINWVEALKRDYWNTVPSQEMAFSTTSECLHNAALALAICAYPSIIN